jgi:hypothetical protein
MDGTEAHINFNAPAVLRKWPSLANQRTEEAALLYEIHTAPQPPMVSAVSSGAHLRTSQRSIAQPPMAKLHSPRTPKELTGAATARLATYGDQRKSRSRASSTMYRVTRVPTRSMCDNKTIVQTRRASCSKAARTTG